MTQTFESWYKSTLALRLDPSDTTATLASVPTVTKGRMYLDNWEQKEWIKFTGVSGSTITGLVRGLSQTADPSTAWTGLTWIAGTKIKLVAMHDQLLDKQEWDDPLISAVVYADTAARDSALWADWAVTIPYTNIYVTATGLFYNYNLSSNVWEAVDTGTVTANASTTVAWKVEQSTAAQNTAWTATWDTGAPLFSTPADLATTIQSGSWVYCASSTGSDTYTSDLTPLLTAYTTGMLLPCKFTTTNTGACSININSLWAKNIKTLDGNDPQTWVIRANGTALLMYDGTNFVIQSEDFATTSNKWIQEMCTDAEALAGTDETRYINSKQAKDNYAQKSYANILDFTTADWSWTVVQAHWLWRAPTYMSCCFYGFEWWPFTSFYGQNGYGWWRIVSDAWSDIITNQTAYLCQYTDSWWDTFVLTVWFDATNITFTKTATGTVSSLSIQMTYVATA